MYIKIIINPIFIRDLKEKKKSCILFQFGNLFHIETEANGHEKYTPWMQENARLSRITFVTLGKQSEQEA